MHIRENLLRKEKEILFILKEIEVYLSQKESGKTGKYHLTYHAFVFKEKLTSSLNYMQGKITIWGKKTTIFQHVYQGIWMFAEDIQPSTDKIAKGRLSIH